jgi:hypothetical protein
MRFLLALAIAVAATAPEVGGQQGSGDQRQNFLACRDGYSYSCDKSRLTSDESRIVEQAIRERNFRYCRDGYTSLCDQRLLTTAQQTAVEQSTRERNFRYCRDGYTSLCDQRLLTTAEKTIVDQEVRTRNIRYCAEGYDWSCDETILTPQQLQEVRSRRAARTEAAIVACAENGSCYGDISDETGRPKTVYVRGYTRRDGTYVRGHYRSPARRPWRLTEMPTDRLPFESRLINALVVACIHGLE